MVVHLITRGPAVRLSLLVIGIWGLAWVLGLLGSPRGGRGTTGKERCRISAVTFLVDDPHEIARAAGARFRPRRCSTRRRRAPES